MASLLRGVFFVFLVVLASAPSASAQNRVLTFHFTPTKRTQLAIWIERPDGSFVATIALTEAVALRGIGNRPGALQMNTGFRYPYGRREGVLPIWAHRRAAAPGAQVFPLVIFQDRPEGWASRKRNDSTADAYFCLSFNNAATSDVDAVSCPSVFNSDKGRYITATDVAAHYGEPYETSPGVGITRELPATSLYPPRHDFTRFTGDCGGGGYAPCDSADTLDYASRVVAAIPEIDAISRATPPADQAQSYQFVAPASWPDGSYVAFLEANTERDFNDTYNATTYPTPVAGNWDSWATGSGVPYRGQPSIVYAVPFTLSVSGASFETRTPVGYGDLHGESGTLHPIDATITDDPSAHAGSGADRLRSLAGGPRFLVAVAATDPCQDANPPPACFQACARDADCPSGFLCGASSVCAAQCSVDAAPLSVESFAAATYPDEKHSHQWARLDFVAATSRRPVVGYELRFTDGAMTTEAEFMQATNAKAATLEAEAVTVCPPDANGNPVCPTEGKLTQIDIGGMHFLTTYAIGVRAVDVCGAKSPIATTELRTTEIHFTQVSPCFVATAAYGSTMAPDVVRLRTFRDETLRTTSLGRAFVDAYYAVGPRLAAALRGHELLRRVARSLLAPSVMGVHFLDLVSSNEGP